MHCFFTCDFQLNTNSMEKTMLQNQNSLTKKLRDLWLLFFFSPSILNSLTFPITIRISPDCFTFTLSSAQD